MKNIVPCAMRVRIDLDNYRSTDDLVASCGDPDYFNALANNPAVFEKIRGRGQAGIDITEAVLDPLNVALECRHGGWVFQNQGGHVYELHTMLLPAKGRNTWQLFMAAFQHLFLRTDCEVIVTRVPHHNEAALKCAARIGFTEEFVQSGAFEAPGGIVDVTHFSLPIHRWVGMLGAQLEACGRQFHNELGEHATHGEDATHDRFVGATLQMIERGMPVKAVWFYNRWAALAGYRTVRLLSDIPLTLDMGDTLLILERGPSKAAWR